jgi:hypothetical protein
VLDRDGFPKPHEVCEGNRQDRSTVQEMLESLEKRTGKKLGVTVVVDRGMAYEENLAEIRAQGYHYLVASRQPERNAWLAEFDHEDDWEEVIRTPWPRNSGQKKSHVQIKRRQKGNEVYLIFFASAKDGRRRSGDPGKTRAATAAGSAGPANPDREGTVTSHREDSPSRGATQGTLPARGTLLPHGG